MKDSSNEQRRIIDIAVIVIAIIAILSLAATIAIWFNTPGSQANKKSADTTIQVIQKDGNLDIDDTILDESVGSAAPIDTEESLIDLYNKFHEINTDVVAYLRIRDSNINMPVAQQHTVCYKHNVVDNCYYLYRDIYKRTAVNNTAIQFMEANNIVSQTIDGFDQTTIIYGHTWSNNERNGKEVRIGNPDDKQFDQLVSYTDMDWLNNHRVLEFTTGIEVTYWVPQYVVYTDASKTTNPSGFNYGKRTLNQDDIDTLYNRSVIINEDAVDIENDRLLLLSTCNSKYENDGTNRLVVLFKYIEADDYFDALDKSGELTYHNHDIIVDWVR